MPEGRDGVRVLLTATMPPDPGGGLLRVAGDPRHLDGHLVCRETYRRRRQLLTGLNLEGASRHVRVPPNYTGIKGADLLDVASAHGVEGVVGKRLGGAVCPDP